MYHFTSIQDIIKCTPSLEVEVSSCVRHVPKVMSITMETITLLLRMGLGVLQVGLASETRKTGTGFYGESTKSPNNGLF